mmetsp:Transcript_25470/g.58719  ORF Transcript_25470/g.58719 Transcript_25470/m.58719 type:complete len:563 (-) Transcript_25470:222-1910(-)
MWATGSPPPPATAAVAPGVPVPASAVLVEAVAAATHWPHATIPGGNNGTAIAAPAPSHVVARTPSACMPLEPQVQAAASPRVLSPAAVYPSRQVTLSYAESPPAPLPVTLMWDGKAVQSPPSGGPPHQISATPMNQMAAAIAAGCKIPVVRCESNAWHCGTPPPLAPAAGTCTSGPATQKAAEQQPLLSELRKQVDDLRFDLTGIRAELEEELRRRQNAEAAKLAADAQARGLRDTMTQLCEELVEREREAERLRSELQEAQLLTRQPGMCKVGDTGSDIVSLNSSAHGRLARARSMNGCSGRDGRASSTRVASSSSNRGRPEPASSGKDASASRTSLASSRASSLSRSNPDTSCTRQSTTPDKRGASLESSRQAHPSEDRWDSRKASVASEALPRRQRPSQVHKSGQPLEVEQSSREAQSTSSKTSNTGRSTRRNPIVPTSTGPHQSQSLDRIPSHARQESRLGTAPLSPWSTLRAVNGQEGPSRSQRLDAATGGTPNGWAGPRRGLAGGPQPQFVDAAAMGRDGQVWVRHSRRNSQSGDWSPPRPSSYRATRGAGHGNKP